MVVSEGAEGSRVGRLPHATLTRLIVRDTDPEGARYQAIHFQVAVTATAGVVIGAALDVAVRGFTMFSLTWVPFIGALILLSAVIARRPRWRANAVLLMYLSLLLWVGGAIAKDYRSLGFVLPGLWAVLSSTALAESRRRGLWIGMVCLAIVVLPIFESDSYGATPMRWVVMTLVSAVLATILIGVLNASAWEQAWSRLQDEEQRSEALAAELAEAKRQLEDRVEERSVDLLERSRQLQERTDQLRESLEHRTRLSRELTELSERDELTGLYNRRYFIARMQERCVRGGPLSLLLLDLDHFKQINDRYGHPAGDDVLVKVSEALNAVVGPREVLARTGGEEFAVLLGSDAPDGALQVAELCRRRILDLTWPGQLSQVRITVSIGVAGLDRGRQAAWEVLMQRADTALYDAKLSGRNQVVSAEVTAP